MDLTDILLLRGELGEEAEGLLGGSGWVGVFGGVGGSWKCCWGWVSVHDWGLRDREKKDLESELVELKVLPLLPGLGP